MADPSPELLSVARHTAILSRKQGLGILLVFLIIMGGRLIRQHMLLGAEGQWRQHLWLDELVQTPASASASETPEKPELTGPLPINTCSLDSLTLLPGVGPVLANRIDAVRREGIVFQSAKDLEVVKGIGPAMSARLAALVVFFDPAPSTVEADSLARQD